MNDHNLITSLRGKLIVSVQADAGNPMDDPYILAAMAETVVQGGAAAVRAGSPVNIRAIRDAVDVPIIGLYKVSYADSPVYITPTMKEARLVVKAGCDVLAVDATQQPRPGGETLEAYFKALKSELTLPIMADVSTLEEGRRAADLGVDVVATTLAGYTPYSRQQEEPDFELVEALVRALKVPVIVEGRIRTPQEVRRALDCGAFAVVVGSMITRPGVITAYFASGLV